jgi:hypothetical protein
LVLVVVAAMLLNVSFANAFNAVTTVLFDATVTDGSLHQSHCLPLLLTDIVPIFDVRYYLFRVNDWCSLR